MASLLRVFAVLAIGLLLAAGPAMAAGSGSDSSGIKRDQDFVKAEGLIKDGQYEAAIPLLQKFLANNPKSADGHNYLGYSHRQLGRMDEAMASYETALGIDPDHRGANEYIGELYLQLGQLDKAEQRLAVLDDACFFGCEEYSELKKAIEDYKAKQGAS